MKAVSTGVQFFVVVVVTAATAIAVALAPEVAWDDWPRLGLFYLLVVLAFSVRVADPRGGSITPSTDLSYLAIYLFSPAVAILVAGIGRTVAFVVSRGWIPWRALVNGALIGLSVFVGAETYGFLGGVPGQLNLSTMYVPLLAGPVAHQIANNFFTSFIFSRWNSTPFLSTWWNGVRELFGINLLSIAMAAFLAIVIQRYGYLTLLIYLVLLPLQGRALQLYLKRRKLYEQVVDGLVVATDVNFPLSRGHAREVADIAEAIAREMQRPLPEVESIKLAALLHDVGMIGKDELLDKPVLEEVDVAGLQDHVRVGATIAKALPAREIASFILSHHERYDGTGYPDGLKGEAIPLGARIIGLAEAVASMASGTFPYAAAVAPAAIRIHVLAERRRGFDPQVVDAFLATLDRGVVGLAEADGAEGDALGRSLGEARAT